jgi:hypothetical protein
MTTGAAWRSGDSDTQLRLDAHSMRFANVPVKPRELPAWMAT